MKHLNFYVFHHRDDDGKVRLYYGNSLNNIKQFVSVQNQLFTLKKTTGLPYCSRCLHDYVRQLPITYIVFHLQIFTDERYAYILPVATEQRETFHVLSCNYCDVGLCDRTTSQVAFKLEGVPSIPLGALRYKKLMRPSREDYRKIDKMMGYRFTKIYYPHD